MTRTAMPRIYVTGTRGLPDIQGGVETHCRELYPRLAAMGCDVTVSRRRSYASADAPRQYRGVAIRDVFAPRIKSLEAAVHTFLSVIDARRRGCDVIHIHAIGPGLFVPFARLLGMKTVVTNHGADYRRPKWGAIARAALRLGEWVSTRFSDGVIAVSPGIAAELRQRYGRTDIAVIVNGVEPPGSTAATDSSEILARYRLQPGKYILAVGRLVEEKGFHDLIEAYTSLARTDIKLVIAGEADHPSPYSSRLKERAAKIGAIMTGTVDKATVSALLAEAALYVLPSCHEGLSISLLEAMAAGKDIALSDIPANQLPQFNSCDYFPPHSPAALARVIARKLASPHPRTFNLTPYDWDRIAAQTLALYHRL